MGLVWRCSCGEEWPEDGSGEGCALAWGHQTKSYREGTRASHVPIGLIDLDTGEVLQKSFSSAIAQRNGWIAKRMDTDYEKRKEARMSAEEAELLAAEADEDLSEDEDSGNSSEEKSGGGSGSGKKGKTPPKKRNGPVVGRVPIIQITIPVELYFLYVLTQSRYEGFDDTPESFTEWLSYCVFKLHTLYPEVFGLQEFLLDAAQARGIKIGVQE